MSHRAALDSAEPYLRSVLRMVAGLTLSFHGAQKLFGLYGGVAGTGLKAPFLTLTWFAGCIETLGGMLIFLGLYAAPVAFLLCGEMAVAYFTQNFPYGFFPIQNQGELAVLYCFIYLYIFVGGPGPLSADYLFRKKYKEDGPAL